MPIRDLELQAPPPLDPQQQQQQQQQFQTASPGAFASQGDPASQRRFGASPSFLQGQLHPYQVCACIPAVRSAWRAAWHAAPVSCLLSPVSTGAINVPACGPALWLQLEGLNWLYQGWQGSRSLILADEMGLGKTVQVG